MGSTYEEGRTMVSNLQRLLELAREYLQNQEVVFSGGHKSNYYFDGRMLTLSGEGCALVGELIWEQIVHLEPQALGGPALGAAPMVTATQMVSYAHGKLVNGFLVREVAKEHGAQKQIEGYLAPKREVVILEDTVSTGTSVFRAIAAAEYHECTILGIIALLDWQIGGGDRLRREGYNFRPFLLGDLSTGKLSLWTPGRPP